tara:strand:- start:8 stop:463 length:456 start_codon:yes stop_codon:yes gene_type:complete
MRRTASSILRDLEIRVANLETTFLPTPSYFLDLVERVLPFRTTRDGDKIEFEGPNNTVFTIEFDDPSDLNNVRVDVSYDFHSRGVARQSSLSIIETSMKKVFGRDTLFSEYDGEFYSYIFVNLQKKDLIEAKSVVKICTQAVKFLKRSLPR